MGETNVFINALPPEVDDNMLVKIFGQYGIVTWSKVLPNHGMPTGAAILEYASPFEASWVVENVNGNIPEGLTTPVNVQFKRAGGGKGSSKGGGGGCVGGCGGGCGGGGYGKAPQQSPSSTPSRSSTLFLGGLREGCSEQELHVLFQNQCQGFERMKFTAPFDGKPGMAWAKFFTSEAAEAALNTISAGVTLPSCPGFQLQAAMAKSDLGAPSVGGGGGGAGMGGGGMAMTSHAVSPYGGQPQQYGQTTPQYSQPQYSASGGSPSAEGGPCDTMFVGCLPASITDQELNAIFMQMPGFVRTKLVAGPRPVAFTLFDSVESCKQAIGALNGAALPTNPTQPITAEFAKNSLDKRGR